MMKLVLVESPAKAKTIGKYLGKDYNVTATMGHVRDLIPKSGSVDPKKHFNMLWEITSQGKKNLPKIFSLAKNAEFILLATDPDREGEGIAWHVYELLIDKGIPSSKIARVSFHEITKSAILESIQIPKEINMDLVHAYLARRALDYLFGFELSPVLWKKLPNTRSAGRVQSVALRFISDNEDHRNLFVSRTYYSVNSSLQSYPVRLISIEGKKLPKEGLSEAQAKMIVEQLKTHPQVTVKKIEEKQTNLSPLPPFSTSLLQQTASTRLGFPPRKTMQLAQRLYEGVSIKNNYIGLITYMRTDSFTLSQGSLQAMRQFIKKRYTAQDVPEKPRIYKTKVKNAQEAHEAIRPTDCTLTPEQLKPFLDSDLLKIYTLIWERAIASQMANAKILKHTVSLEHPHATLQLNGQSVAFQGFLKVWKMKIDTTPLPNLKENDKGVLSNIESKQHETEPPPHLNDASLIKTLEENGIGRPSTYSSIISLLIDRSYTLRDNKKILISTTGRILVAFLIHFFKQFVDPKFTAALENQLDSISNGDLTYQEVLAEFWTLFHQRIESITDLSRDQIIEVFEKHLTPYLESKDFHRLCPKCKVGHLHMKIGRAGIFLGCDRYPECDFTENVAFKGQEHIIIGKNPANNEDILLKHGSHGPYVETNENNELKRTSVSRPFSVKSLDLNQALFLLSLPKKLGIFQDKDMILTTGPFGPYVRYADEFFVAIPKSQLQQLTYDQAVVLVTKHLQKLEKQTLGFIENNPIYFKKSRFGTYLSYKKKKYPLAKNSQMKDISLSNAKIIIQETKKKKTTSKKASSAKTRKKKNSS